MAPREALAGGIFDTPLERSIIMNFLFNAEIAAFRPFGCWDSASMVRAGGGVRREGCEENSEPGNFLRLAGDQPLESSP